MCFVPIKYQPDPKATRTAHVKRQLKPTNQKLNRNCFHIWLLEHDTQEHGIYFMPEVLTALKMSVCRYDTPCGPVEVYQRFEKCLHAPSVGLQVITWRHEAPLLHNYTAQRPGR
jgi:hypothetical protein